MTSRAEFIRSLPLPEAAVADACEAAGYPRPSRQAIRSARQARGKRGRPKSPTCPECGGTIFRAKVVAPDEGLS